MVRQGCLREGTWAEIWGLWGSTKFRQRVPGKRWVVRSWDRNQLGVLWEAKEDPCGWRKRGYVDSGSCLVGQHNIVGFEFKGGGKCDDSEELKLHRCIPHEILRSTKSASDIHEFSPSCLKEREREREIERKERRRKEDKYPLRLSGC